MEPQADRRQTQETKRTPGKEAARETSEREREGAVEGRRKRRRKETPEGEEPEETSRRQRKENGEKSIDR